MNKEIAPVLDEISAVLKKHDMAGLIIVGNKTHCDFRMEVEPSWSCARIEQQTNKEFLLRIRSKASEYPSRAAQKESQEQTIGLFVTFEHILDNLRTQMVNLLVTIAKQVPFEGKSTRED